MSGISRRQFLSVPGLCWPERGRDSGCKVLGRNSGEYLPVYRLESRVPDRAFEATFRVARHGGRGLGPEETATVVRSHEVHWRRDADGSTHIRVPTEIFALLLHTTIHFQSDLRRGELMGFAEFGGLFGPFTVLVGEDRAGQPPTEPGTPDRAQLRPNFREDGSLAGEDEYLPPLGGVEMWRYRDLAVEADAPDSLAIDGRSWPVRRIEVQTGVHPLAPMRIRLTVWVSDELSLVLREEARVNEELSRTWETVTLKLSAGGP
jgi:hypothetical protein